MAEQEQFEGLVVPTTHWDRDWYWSFERFRVKLLECFAGLKELWASDPDYVFTCDGQTIMVEDYLDALPEERPALLAMGQAGRLRMGPLYVLSDVYCTGGEALIRNLLLGAAQADAFQARQRVVYLPDTFGLTPEMPMLTAGFGYDCIVFMRGLPAAFDQEQRFWHWQAADGSTTMVYRLRDGYANAARLGRTWGTGEIMDSKSSGIHPGFSLPDALAKLQASVDRLQDGQGAPQLLLAGVDHQIPQPELPEILTRATTDRQSFRYAGLDEVAAAMRAHPGQEHWPTITGECHGDPGGQILGGTVSSRIALKYDNAQAEELLHRVAEPATALLHQLGNREGLDGICREAWRQLLRAHPHDDITGCSCDLVHRENQAAITRATQAATAIRRRSAYLLVQAYGGQVAGDERAGFILADVGGNGIRGRQRIELDFEGRASWGDCPPPAAYRIVDQDGEPVPFRELERRSGIEHPHLVLTIEIDAHLTAGSLRRYFIEPLPATPPAATSMVLSNDHLHVSVADDGSITLVDHHQGSTWQGLGRFFDQADGGDAYNFSPIPGDQETALSPVIEARQMTGHQGLQCLTLSGYLMVPRSSDATGRDATLTRLPISISYSLAPADRSLQVDITFDNTACDHRLRWCLDLGERPATSRAGLKYHSVERPVLDPWTDDQELLHLPIHPTDHYVAASRADGSGLAVFCPCPVNYEVCDQRLAITVLRAVGRLSGGHLTRGPGAGPEIRTPDGQCLGRQQLRFAIHPFARADSGQLFTAAWRWRQQAAYGVLWAADPDWDGRPQAPWLTCSDGPIVIVALKRSQDRRQLILRLFNSSDHQASCSLGGSMLDGARLLPARLDETATGAAACPIDRPIALAGGALSTFIVDHD